MFDIDNSMSDRTRINYLAAFVNTHVAAKFQALMDAEGKAKGSIDIAPIYCIP